MKTSFTVIAQKKQLFHVTSETCYIQIKNAISKNDFVNPENPDKVTSVSRECQTGKQLFLYLLPKEV